MPLQRIPATLITGATGAGKTTLIARAWKQRPAAERWAVLVNDFGRSTLSAAEVAVDADVIVREVAGCVCCTGQVLMRTALVSLLRDARPHRLLIEASAAAEPAAVRRVLAEPALANAVELKSTLCAVDGVQLADERYLASNVYREQIAAADVIVLDASRLTECAHMAALARLEAMCSTPPRVVQPTGAGALLGLL